MMRTYSRFSGAAEAAADAPRLKDGALLPLVWKVLFDFPEARRAVEEALTQVCVEDRVGSGPGFGLR